MRFFLSFALSETKAGLKGFGLLIACLAIGVAAITGVMTLASGLTSGIYTQGRVILGGDVSFSTLQRDFNEDELRFISPLGQTTRLTTLRAMARSEAGENTLIELKAIDAAYPLYGTLTPQKSQGLLVEEALLYKLNVKIGEKLTLGQASFPIAGILREEPDKLASGFGLGARVILSQEELAQTGLIQPGSLYRSTLKVKTTTNLETLERDYKEKFKDTGLEIRNYTKAAPQTETQIERLAQFMTLVSLMSLFIGGMGVAQAVRLYLEKKQEDIATLKSLGATTVKIMQLYFLQILLAAGIGIFLGLLLGAALPTILSPLITPLLPFKAVFTLEPQLMLKAASYGLVITMLFTFLPLDKIRLITPAFLFRDSLDNAKLRPSPLAVGLTLLSVGLLVLLTLSLAYHRPSALYFLGAALVTIVLLHLLSFVIVKMLKMLPSPRSMLLRFTLSNMLRENGILKTLILALGFGLTLVSTLIFTQTAIQNQLQGPLKTAAPHYFLMDIPARERENFSQFVLEKSGGSLESVPMLRGRITHLKGQRAEDVKLPENMRWVFSGDRGVTMADTLPSNSRLVAGQFWDKAYEGKPLVSLEDKLAKDLGLKLGDKMTVNILGRSIEVEIAALREVNWQSFGINFFMVFSPNTLKGAPYNLLATVSETKTNESLFLKELGAAYPSVTAISVRDAMAQIVKLTGQVTQAVSFLMLFALFTALLVLAGALAGAEQARLYDTVMLKTLGASSRKILAFHALEYLLLGAIVAAFALALGYAISYGIGEIMLKGQYSLQGAKVWLVLVMAMGITLLFGLFGTFRLLKQKPMAVLRHL
jgi:putative ABC transport system permease protein